MSPGNPVDLDSLTRERAPKRSDAQPPRRWLRYAVPLVLLLAFAGVFASSAGELLRGATRVSVVRPEPVTGEGAAAAAAGTVVAQAAGWVEPDPFPMRATALAEGVVAELLVQESDRVEKGDVLARLVSDDARLAQAKAAAVLARAEVDCVRAEAELAAARAAFATPTALLEAVAVGRAEVEGKVAEAHSRALGVAKGHALVRLAEDELLVQKDLEAAGAAGPRQVEIAEARVEEAQAELAILQADAALAAAGATAARARLERAEKDHELRIEDSLRVQVAEQACASAQAMAAEARAELGTAELALARMEVRAPAAGVVLERLATPGSILEGETAAVVTLYDPASVRVRVDVPQQDLARLFVGQEALVDNDARRGQPYRGEVLRIVRKADIQKVTLQAHVRILDGDELLRPEMLMQVRFLAPAAPEGTAAPTGVIDPARVSIPARLLLPGDRVWVVDGASGRAAQREVQVALRAGERAIVAAGLNLSDKLIDAGREDLAVGDRIALEER